MHLFDFLRCSCNLKSLSLTLPLPPPLLSVLLRTAGSDSPEPNSVKFGFVVSPKRLTTLSYVCVSVGVHVYIFLFLYVCVRCAHFFSCSFMSPECEMDF